MVYNVYYVYLHDFCSDMTVISLTAVFACCSQKGEGEGKKIHQVYLCIVIRYNPFYPWCFFSSL